MTDIIDGRQQRGLIIAATNKLTRKGNAWYAAALLAMAFLLAADSQTARSFPP